MAVEIRFPLEPYFPIRGRSKIFPPNGLFVMVPTGLLTLEDVSLKEMK